jgi:hypothetical protein
MFDPPQPAHEGHSHATEFVGLQPWRAPPACHRE